LRWDKWHRQLDEKRKATEVPFALEDQVEECCGEISEDCQQYWNEQAIAKVHFEDKKLKVRHEADGESAASRTMATNSDRWDLLVDAKVRKVMPGVGQIDRYNDWEAIMEAIKRDQANEVVLGWFPTSRRARGL
jgi:hypothetical protein